MQHEIIQTHNLLDENGHVIEAGWAKQAVLTYSKDQVKETGLPGLREWDYYLIANSSFGIAMSIAANTHYSRLSLNVLDFKAGKHYTGVDILEIAKSSLVMPNEPMKEIEYRTERSEAHVIPEGNTIQYKLRFKDFFGKEVTADLVLTVPETETMTIVVPFDESKEMFYYNHKLNCMKVSGKATFGETVLDFDKEEDSFSVYDWGRGVWPNKNQWFWGSASGVLNGIDFGFNIGYGFGNTSAASENMLFYNGKVHKLEQVDFGIPASGYMNPWNMTSSDGRFEVVFTPVLDRSSDVAGLGSDQHQVFGTFTGTVILDDGTKLELDKFFGFAEEVNNSW